MFGGVALPTHIIAIHMSRKTIPEDADYEDEEMTDEMDTSLSADGEEALLGGADGWDRDEEMNAHSPDLIDDEFSDPEKPHFSEPFTGYTPENDEYCDHEGQKGTDGAITSGYETETKIKETKRDRKLIYAPDGRLVEVNGTYLSDQAKMVPYKVTENDPKKQSEGRQQARDRYEQERLKSVANWKQGKCMVNCPGETMVLTDIYRENESKRGKARQTQIEDQVSCRGPIGSEEDGGL